MAEEKTKIENKEIAESDKKEKKQQEQKKESQKNVKDINTMSKKELGNVKSLQKSEVKQPEQKEKKDEKPKVKKYEAFARGMNLHGSKKHFMYICNFIKNKDIDNAVSDLESVVDMKRPIPFKGEIPHRKGRIMSGRYPVKASKIMITLLKGLKGNAIANGMDLDKTRIKIASASWANRPLRRNSVEAKRTNINLIAKELNSPKEKE